MLSIVRKTVIFGCLLATVGCAQPPNDPGGPSGPSGLDLTTLASVTAPPRGFAAEPAQLERASQTAATAAATGLEGRRGLRMLEVSAIPYLRASPEGAQFLASRFPRALARGEPAAQCPAAAASTAGAATTDDAAQSALAACFRVLDRRGADPKCGCKVLAADGVLLARRDDFAFAPSVSALLIEQRRPLRHLIAESLPPVDGAEIVLIRDLQGEVGRLILKGEMGELNIGGEVYSGRREPFGYRRGRLAERLRLSDSEGRAATLLIGVERRDALAR